MISRKWDASSPAERAEILRRDESMRSPDWAPLVLKMSSRCWADLTHTQRLAVEDLIGETT